MALRPGQRLIDRYQIRKVERSAPAYESARATQLSNKQEVVLWGVRSELLPSDRFKQAFLQDAQRARGFYHQYARPILDFGADPACCFVTLAPLEGESLDERIKTGKSVRDKHLVRLALALGDALEAAASLGMLHGRLTPADVRLAGDGPKIAGIGLWGALEPGAAQHAYRQDIRYVAPEVRVGGQITPRADVYSVAVLLGEITLGRYLAGTMVHDQLRERLRSQRPALLKALGVALSQEPGARPGSVREFAALLERTLPMDEGASGSQSSQAGSAAVRGNGPRSAVPVGSVPQSSPGGSSSSGARGKGGARITGPQAAPGASSSSRSSSSKKGAAFTSAGEVQVLEAREDESSGSGKLIVVVGALLLVGAGAGVVLALREKKPAKPAKDDGVVVTARPDAARAGGTTPVTPLPFPTTKEEIDRATGCPKSLVRIEQRDAFCIDPFEMPGKGVVPVVNLDADAAAAACTARGLRLCTMSEWTEACRGAGGLGFPYGAAFEAKKCNVKEAGQGRVLPGGSMPDCVSKPGAFDMSGNVAEWIAGGYTMGGSAMDGQDGRCVRATRRSSDAKADDLGVRCCVDAVKIKTK